MTQFHHWDFWNEFTAEEVAALIMGIDPSELNESNRKKIKPIINRMHECYQNAIDFYIEHASSRQEFIETKVGSKNLKSTIHTEDEINFQKNELINNMLESIVMKSALHFGVDVENWPKHKEIVDFNRQKFTRLEIVNWIRNNCYESEYEFEKEQKQTVLSSPQNRHWPWGEYSTELLGHLEAAAKKFWSDYKNDHSKAPFNKQVEGWLMVERKLSESKAKAIASILRADGIPTGPRKNL